MSNTEGFGPRRAFIITPKEGGEPVTLMEYWDPETKKSMLALELESNRPVPESIKELFSPLAQKLIESIGRQGRRRQGHAPETTPE